MPARTAAKTYDCDICSAVLKSQRDLDNHRCLLHDDCGEARLGTPITFRCITCGEAFTLRSDLFAHLQERGHGHPGEWDKARPPGTQRPRRSRGRGSG
jgi:DNA-directed RNA polymerase subunit RPC12/RpoP